MDQVRALLRRLFDEISELTADAERRAQARVMLSELLDRIELDPTSATARLHYSIKTSSAATGDKVATPRGFEPLLQP